MAIREIIVLPDKQLRLVSRPVEKVTAELRKLADDYYTWRNQNYPVASSDADGEINCHPALHACEQTLDRFHRVHIMPSDSVNHQAALDPNFRRRTSRLNRANQNSATRHQAKGIGY